MINALAQEIHANSKAKGFKHDDIPRMLLLAISELTEAMEADRSDKRADMLKYNANEFDSGHNYNFGLYIKDTFEDELADAAIRIFDIAASQGIDLEFHIHAKMNYNASRPFKHGNKKY